jgi:DHA1 family bicyclomycin/chloramphenicol resistance-like MFS transporter
MIELLGVEQEYFGYTFMSVVFGYIAGALTSSRLVNRWGTLRVLTLGQSVGLGAAGLLLVLALFDVYRLIPVLFAFFLVFMSGGLCLSIGQMGAISELPKDAGKASSVFGFLQITLAALLGYLVGLFYNNTLVPTAIGVTIAALLSATGYLIIRNSHESDGAPA